MAQTHLADPGSAERTRCRLPVSSPAWSAARGHTLPLAEHARDANCVRCLRQLRDAIEAGSEPEPFDRQPAYSPVYGAREIGLTGASAIATVRRGEAPAGRGWPSPAAAVRSYYRAQAEGAALRSTSDPDRANRVQVTRDPSLGGREHAAVDRHRTVALALDRAELDGEGLADACPALTPAQAREVFVVRVVGRAQSMPTRFGGRELKGRWLDWIGYGTEDVVDRVKQAGIVITEREVERVVRHFLSHVRDALLASGEMRPSVSEERERPARAWDPLRRLREANG